MTPSKPNKTKNKPEKADRTKNQKSDIYQKRAPEKKMPPSKET